MLLSGNGLAARPLKLAAILGLTAVACGLAPESDPAPIVARVDGEPVSAEELRAAAPSQAGRPEAIDWSAALDSWVTARILREEVDARGLRQGDGYRKRLDAVRSRAWRSEHQLDRDTLLEDIEKTLSFSDEELRARYQEQRDRFLTTRLRLRQITVPDRETIRAIQRRVNEGENFAGIAAQANVDPALRSSSGDTGWIEQRAMPTAMIGPAHRLLEEGEVSEPFRDREGRWNLVQLIGREKGVRREFEDVKDQLARELRVIRSREILARVVDTRRARIRASLETIPD